MPRHAAGNMRQAIIDGRPIPGKSQILNGTGIGDVGRLAMIYQRRLIIASAILEGAAFFNLIAYMLEHEAHSALASPSVSDRVPRSNVDRK